MPDLLSSKCNKLVKAKPPVILTFLIVRYRYISTELTRDELEVFVIFACTGVVRGSSNQASLVTAGLVTNSILLS